MSTGKKISAVLVLFSIALYKNTESHHFLRKFRGPPSEKVTSRCAKKPIWKEIEQRVDHFQPTQSDTWTMRYLENDQFYKNGAPIFIFLGGEWAISESALMSGQLFRMAEEHHGIMYYTEHRYYGKSFPTADLSSENLKYLSADQALADIAYFIEEKKEELFSRNNETNKQPNKVVVLGGSYSANLATWGRLKYPHLIQAAWASSGPLRAVTDFYEYMEVVNENLGLASEQCVNVIQDAISQTQQLLETPEGIETISKSYNTCTPVEVKKPQHRALFFENIAGHFAGIVQYAKTGDLDRICNQLLAEEGDSYQKLGKFMRKNSGGSCMDNYDQVIEEMRNIKLPPPRSAFRQWTYQTCAEYGYFQTSTSKKQPFGSNFDVDFFIKLCRDVFGNNFTKDLVDRGVMRTNIFYGSTKPDVRQVVTIHGSVDPWHRLGVLKDLNEDAPAIFVQGTSHCMDIASSSEKDLPELKNAKNRANELVRKWLKQQDSKSKEVTRKITKKIDPVREIIENIIPILENH